MDNNSKKAIVKNRIDKDIKDIDNKIAELMKIKNNLKSKKEILSNIGCFSKEEAIEIIEYLVNTKEKENYSVEDFYLSIKSSNSMRNIVSQYTLLYLVNDEKKEEAKEEIIKQYGATLGNDNEYYISRDSLSNIEKTSNNYVKLSFHNKYNDHKISFDSNSHNHSVSTIIVEDDRFKYINEYMVKVLGEKLCKPDLNMTMFEMKRIADTFIKDYNSTRKLEKKISN